MICVFLDKFWKSRHYLDLKCLHFMKLGRILLWDVLTFYCWLETKCGCSICLSACLLKGRFVMVTLFDRWLDMLSRPLSMPWIFELLREFSPVWVTWSTVLPVISAFVVASAERKSKLAYVSSSKTFGAPILFSWVSPSFYVVIVWLSWARCGDFTMLFGRKSK